MIHDVKHVVKNKQCHLIAAVGATVFFFRLKLEI
jgi:hypothetical protein